MSDSPLAEFTAFAAVQSALSGGRVDVNVQEPSFRRLLRAIGSLRQEEADRPSSADLGVLVRQCLRYWSERTGEAQSLTVTDGLGLPAGNEWADFGIVAQPVGDRMRLQAKPWSPSWLGASQGDAIDARVAGEEPRRHFEAVPADPFMAKLGLDGYLSSSQRVAVRSALAAPSGSTMVVALATGEGKSLVFLGLDALARGGSETDAGVTLVITPTVALALDHEASMAQLPLPRKVRAYRGGSERRTNDSIVRSIESGTQGLVFASPEAACGALRAPLERASERGYLRGFVVDEAHLVDTWGDEFRPEFQMLSGLRRALLRVDSRGFSTFLLSATLSRSALHVLRVLFGQRTDGTLQELKVGGVPGLRREIEYWLAQSPDALSREPRVLESLRHLPRAAILYVTERSEAVAWFGRLRGLGFRRLELVTGDTPTDERERIVQAWKSESVDLVVGTSAFGLGINNPHVRTVLHVCLPESLDRYYQEVGRAGRDGCAAISLLMPVPSDRNAAVSLNRRKLITIEKGRERWVSMFRHPDRRDLGQDEFAVRLDVPPGAGRGRIDMISERSTAWNIKTLTLMAGSRMLTLQDAVRHKAIADQLRGTQHSDRIAGQEAIAGHDLHPYGSVHVLEPGHLDEATWVKKVQPYRRYLADVSNDSLSLLVNYLHGSRCIGGLLAQQYAIDAEVLGGDVSIPVVGSCGGCHGCRQQETQTFERTLVRARHPWPPRSVDPPLSQLLDETGRLLVVYEPPLVPSGARARRRLFDALSVLLRSGVHAVVAPKGSRLEELQTQLSDWPLFWSDPEDARSLPPGPTLVYLNENSVVRRNLTRPWPQEMARIVFATRGHEDPLAPGDALLDRYSGRQMDVADFQRAILS